MCSPWGQKQVPSCGYAAQSPTLHDCNANPGDADEIPYPVGLEDALAILLAILDREPASYSKGAARRASRLALEHKLTLPDAQLALAALAVLPTPGARAGVGALINAAENSGLRRVDELPGDWMRRRGIGD
jgi:hypothetical protein